MKKRFYGVIVAAFIAISSTGYAQDGTVNTGLQPHKPAITQPVYAAMFFNKLAGRTPDFNSWARATHEFQNAPVADRFVVQEQQAKNLQNVYSLLTLQELMTIEVPVTLSAYDGLRKGFFVTNFKDDTFFPIRYDGQSYGIVPQGIMDRQWMKVTDENVAARIVQANASKGDKSLTMIVVMTPKYAEGSAPMNLDGENYWLVSTEISQLLLYAPDSIAPLWQSDMDTSDDLKRQEILNLRQ